MQAQMEMAQGRTCYAAVMQNAQETANDAHTS